MGPENTNNSNNINNSQNDATGFSSLNNTKSEYENNKFIDATEDAKINTVQISKSSPINASSNTASSMPPILEDVSIIEKIKKSAHEILKPLRTYQSDAAEALRKTGGSVTKIALAEHKKKFDIEKAKNVEHVEQAKISNTTERQNQNVNTNETRSEQPKSQAFVPEATTIQALEAEETNGAKKRIVQLLTIAAIFIIVGAGIFGYFVWQRKTDDVPAPIARNILLSDEEKEVAISTGARENSSKTIRATADSIKGELGRVISLIPVIKAEERTMPVSIHDFIFSANIKPSTELARALINNYVVGVHIRDTNEIFLVFRTDSKDNAFTGMLNWEPTAARDLATMLNLKIEEEKKNLTNPFADKKFEDLIISNIDTRAIKNEKGEIMLIYSIIDKYTVVIAPSKETLEKAVARIREAQLVR